LQSQPVPTGARQASSQNRSPQSVKVLITLGADGVISKAQFAELRAYLQAFPGRVQETQIA